ncbi:MAG: tetraacyldisaccharide 4'-kinase, partial [Gemmatimonadaceae bacterium]
MRDPSVVERVWFGAGTAASLSRALLTPVERLFGAIVGARELMYDAGWLASRDTSIPALSVGNLTVGGTGKTPIAAWLARGLADRGARPAVVLRGYGQDEPLVHRALNPDIPVVLGRDRRDAIERAARDGADIAVLDDAFQHRQVRRFADLVLVNADRWTPRVRLLPAGPWRERLEAIRRATLIIVTRKTATDSLVERVHTALAQVAATVPRVSVRLEQMDLRRAEVDASDERLPIDAVAGASIRAVLSIA